MIGIVVGEMMWVLHQVKFQDLIEIGVMVSLPQFVGQEENALSIGGCCQVDGTAPCHACGRVMLLLKEMV